MLFSFQVRCVRAHVKYDRGTLLQLGELSHMVFFRHKCSRFLPGVTPGQVTAGGCPGTRRRIRKRGRRGGKEQRLCRLVRKGRLTLPIILLTNVQSLVNKMDDLFSRIATPRYIQNCSVLCFCETWLGRNFG